MFFDRKIDRAYLFQFYNSDRVGSQWRLIGSLCYILVDLGRGTVPRSEKMAGGCPGVDSQDLATILDPFWAIFTDLEPDHLSVLSQQQTSVLSQQKTSVLSQQQTSAASEVAWRSWRGLGQKLTKTIEFFCI